MTSRIVENAGSEARDHLANERTFLAWLRTALGLVGLGVVLARVGDEVGALPSRLGGMALVVFGIVCLVYALVRYARVARCLREGHFPVARNGPVVVGAASVLVALLVLVYLWH